jgi:hypothetical protein
MQVAMPPMYIWRRENCQSYNCGQPIALGEPNGPLWRLWQHTYRLREEHRHCRMMELDPAYCDVIVKRWEDFTGNKAMLEESKEAF